MRAGRLKYTISVTRRITRKGTPDTWAPIATLRAEIISSDARAFIAEAGEHTERAVVFRVRFRDGIEAGDRVTHGEDVFAIAELKEIVARRVLELRCTGGKP